MRERLWQDWVNMVFGAWLFIAPWIGLAGMESAVWNSWFFGAAIAVFAIASLTNPRRWKEWVNLLIGIWLIIAPFVLGFAAEGGALWNHLIIGALVGIDALWAMQAVPMNQPIAHT